jgi:hypothetical protein
VRYEVHVAVKTSVVVQRVSSLKMNAFIPLEHMLPLTRTHGVTTHETTTDKEGRFACSLKLMRKIKKMKRVSAGYAHEAF